MAGGPATQQVALSRTRACAQLVRDGRADGTYATQGTYSHAPSQSDLPAPLHQGTLLPRQTGRQEARALSLASGRDLPNRVSFKILARSSGKICSWVALRST
jgi:hypothetical protein